MKVMGFCRYSVITHDGNAWKIGKSQTWDEYQATVLDPQRLAKRLYFLEHFLLPSIAGQSLSPAPDWFRFCLLVTDQLQPNEHEALLKVVSQYPWCKVALVSSEKGMMQDVINKEFRGFVKDDPLFITFRIDDDDALGTHFLKQLRPLGRECYRGHIVSFPFGYKALFDSASGCFTWAAEQWQPLNAQGLAYVGHSQDKISHVFQSGSHTRVDRKLPLLTLPDGPMYLRTFHDDNDVLSVTEEGKRQARIERIFERDPTVSLSELVRHFAFLKDHVADDEKQASCSSERGFFQRLKTLSLKRE